MQITLNNGLAMPLIGYGTYDMGTAEVLTALQAGYRQIDTAHGYRNEKEVGIAMKESGIPREDIFLVTKVTTGALREDTVLQEFEQSLQNLGTDYVALYLIHWPVKEKYVDAWKVMEQIYTSGRAKSIGVSNFQTYHLDELRKHWRIVPAVNQIELHPKMTQRELVVYCQKDNIAIQAWSPLGAGKAAMHENPVLLEIAGKYSVTPAQVIMRWIVEQGIVAIPRSRSAERIKLNREVEGFELTPAECEQITGLNENLRTGPDPDNFSF